MKPLLLFLFALSAWSQTVPVTARIPATARMPVGPPPPPLGPALQFHTLSTSADGKVALTSALDSTGTVSIAVIASWTTTATPGTFLDYTNTCGNSTTTCNTWYSGSVYGDSPFFYAATKIYYCLSCTVGAGHVFKMDFGGTTASPSLVVMGFTVVSHYQTSSAVGAIGTTSQATPTLTPGQANSIIVTGCASTEPLFTATPSVSSPFATVEARDNIINNMGIGAGYWVGGTAQTPTWDSHSPVSASISVAALILY